jgi:two-component system cell cycle sensor histidine kinase/response regulator CckA
VLAGCNASDALNAANSHEGGIDLLITDVVMPGGSGRELAERLILLRPKTRVLYISGYTDDAVVRHGVLESAVSFLMKPFTPAELAAKIRTLLDAA